VEPAPLLSSWAQARHARNTRGQAGRQPFEGGRTEIRKGGSLADPRGDRRPLDGGLQMSTALGTACAAQAPVDHLRPELELGEYRAGFRLHPAPPAAQPRAA